MAIIERSFLRSITSMTYTLNGNFTSNNCFDWIVQSAKLQHLLRAIYDHPHSVSFYHDDILRRKLSSKKQDNVIGNLQGFTVIKYQRSMDAKEGCQTFMTILK